MIEFDGQTIKRKIKKDFNYEFQRQKLNNDSDSDSDYDEEAPQIVVVKKGDLTAEEAEAEQKRIEKGEQIHQIFTVQLKFWILLEAINQKYEFKSLFDSK